MKKFYKMGVICILLFMSVYAQSKRVEGKVVEIETNKPIENCIVFLYELDEKITQMAVTDSTGYFLFNEISAKFVKVSVEKITYDGAIIGPMRLKKNKPVKLKVVLTPIPHYTDEVVVATARDRKDLQETGFYNRKMKGLGKFISFEDIKKKRFHSIWQIIQDFPQLGLDGQNLIYNKRARTGLKGTSAVTIYIDGIIHEQLIPVPSSGSEKKESFLTVSLDQVLNLEQVSGVEFYSGSAEIPIQYSKFNTAAGVLLIWTKRK